MAEYASLFRPTSFRHILALRIEAPMTHERIEINPDIMGGKPAIRGTRVPVETILRKLGAGMITDAILADHPRLTRDDVLAAQAFAADYITDEELVYG
jgi:uncharacterized protein (DUF433 family)